MKAILSFAALSFVFSTVLASAPDPWCLPPNIVPPSNEGWPAAPNDYMDAAEVRARVNSTEHNADDRQPGNVYVCTGANFTESCRVVYAGLSIDHCSRFDNALSRGTGSIYIEQGTICYLAEEAGTAACDAHTRLTSGQSITDMKSVNREGTDETLSRTTTHVVCIKCAGC